MVLEIKHFYLIVTTSQFGAKENKMEYTVTSSKTVCGKINGEKLTEDDIIAYGSSVEFLVNAGHIKKAGQTPKAVKEIKEEVQVLKEEPEAFVFNTFNNEQGDK
jgi:hypothetical protein